MLTKIFIVFFRGPYKFGPLSIKWHYLHQDGIKTYSEISNMRSYWKYSKATICTHMKNNIGDLVITIE